MENDLLDRRAYQAIAQYSGKDAGFVCFGSTEDRCRAYAHTRTTMTIEVRRVMVSAETWARIIAAEEGDTAQESVITTSGPVRCGHGVKRSGGYYNGSCKRPAGHGGAHRRKATKADRGGK